MGGLSNLRAADRHCPCWNFVSNLSESVESLPLLLKLHVICATGRVAGNLINLWLCIIPLLFTFFPYTTVSIHYFRIKGKKDEEVCCVAYT